MHATGQGLDPISLGIVGHKGFGSVHIGYCLFALPAGAEGQGDQEASGQGGQESGHRKGSERAGSDRARGIAALAQGIDNVLRMLGVAGLDHDVELRALGRHVQG